MPSEEYCSLIKVTRPLLKAASYTPHAYTDTHTHTRIHTPASPPVTVWLRIDRRCLAALPLQFQVVNQCQATPPPGVAIGCLLCSGRSDWSPRGHKPLHKKALALLT